MKPQFRFGFTLIELLVVIGIISLLATLLFPVFVRAQKKAQETACASNLHQIGMAIAMYGQDYDQSYPYAIDGVDKHTDHLKLDYNGQYWPGMTRLPLLSEVLQLYTKSRSLWRCPSDIGMVPGQATPYSNAASHVSFFSDYGMSYCYSFDLSVMHISMAGLTAHTDQRTEVGAASIPIVYDCLDYWHGDYTESIRSKNILMGDGHVIARGNQSLQTQSWLYL